jgi:ferredoxin
MLTQPEFHNRNCTRYRFRYSECGACSAACPHDAIELTSEGIAISETTCQNCALCTAACPIEALTAHNLPRVELLRRAIKQPEVTFACAPSGLPADEIVPCLGALDGAMLALLVGRGIGVTLAGTHHCGTCSHGEIAQRMLARHLEVVELLRQTVGGAAWGTISVPSEVIATKMEHDASRRHLFRRVFGRTFNGVAEAAADLEKQPVPMTAIRIASPVLTVGRDLLQKLFDNAPKDAPRVPHHEGVFAGQIELAAGCTVCEACARACPTAALKIGENAVSWALMFQFSRCVGCGLCLEVCQPRALRFADAMKSSPEARTPMPLRTLNKQRCNQCDRLFISAEPAENCTICESDDADFAAFFG